MNPLYDKLNEELDRQMASSWASDSSDEQQITSMSLSDIDADVAELVALARSIHAAASLRVEPNFAENLEQRLLAHNRTLSLRVPNALDKASALWNEMFSRLRRTRPAVQVALGFCVLLLLVLGVLGIASQIWNPANPLYAINQWEQNVRIALAGSPASKADLVLQFADNQLNELPMLANPADSAGV